MKKLKELIKYGDTEPLEIVLAIVLIGQLCHPSPSIFCWHSILPEYYYFFGVLSGAGMLFGNFTNNLKIRKWSSNIAFIIILGVIVISIYSQLDSIQMYVILFIEFLALFWVTWRCSTQEVFYNIKTSKMLKNNE